MIVIATIKEIAKIAQVSSATVSRVLSKDVSFHVPEETRQKIIEIAKSMNYRKKANRRRIDLDDARDWKLGLIFWCSEQFEFADPFYMTIRRGIEKECAKQEISIHKVFRWIDDASPNLDFTGLDGVIVVGKVDAQLLNVADSEVPVVFIDHHCSDRYDSVQFDGASAATCAVEHLLQLGHKRIGYIGGTSYIRMAEGIRYFEDERQKVYVSLMKERGLYRQDRMFIGDWGADEGYRLMKEAIRKGDLPEAFFIASDPMAIGALRALDESGVKVPEQTAIVSIDCIDISQYVSPPLTTVKVFTEEMGITAVKLLVDRLLGREVPLSVTVSTKLIIRNSCGALS